MNLEQALDLLDDFVKRYADQAIAEKAGVNYRSAPRHFFRVAAQDHHLRNPGWLITYQQGSRSSERTSLGPQPDMETLGNLRVTFALAGHAVKDESRLRKDQQHSDNWGTRQFTTLEERRRFEQQTCRGVAVRFANLIMSYCNVRQLYIQSSEISDNLPHIESSNLIWWPVTIDLTFRFWWQKV